MNKNSRIYFDYFYYSLPRKSNPDSWAKRESLDAIQGKPGSFEEAVQMVRRPRNYPELNAVERQKRGGNCGFAAVQMRWRLTFGELALFAGTLEAELLAFFLTRIAANQVSTLESALEAFVHNRQCLGNT